MRIVHNLSAANAWRVNQANNSGVAASIKKLSSGLRVNAAADDAAGLAISEKMRAQIRGLNQAQRNAQDGLSLIQTAEGSIGSIQSALHRMRELCLQAANDTLTDADRQSIQQEIDQLKAGIGDIAGQASFNGIKLLDGSLSANPHAVSASAAPGLAIPASADIVVDGRTITFDFADLAGTVQVTARHGADVLGTGTVSAAMAEPVVEWQRALGGTGNEEIFSIEPTTDGGYIAAGRTDSNDGDVSGNHGSDDFWVVKLNSDGSLAWQKTLGGGGGEYAYSIRQTADGGYIVAGGTSSLDGDVSGVHGLSDAWVVKLDNTGAIEWQQALGGTDNEEVFSVEPTADGGYVVAGHTGSNDGDVSGNHGGVDDIWVAKLDNTGAIEWQRALGGTSFEYGYSVQPTSDGGYVLTGYTRSTDGDVTGQNGADDMWVVKLNADGSMAWQRAIGTNLYEAGQSVRQTDDGGFVVAGIDGNQDAWVVKLNADGSTAWEKSYGGSLIEGVMSIRQTADGGYVFAGMAESTDGDVSANQGGRDLWVVKLDGDGDLVWEKPLGGSNNDVNSFMEVQQAGDGGYIIASTTQSNDGDVTGFHGGQDGWIVKLGPDMMAGAASLSLPDIADQSGVLNFGSVTVTVNAAMDTVTGIYVSATAESTGLVIQAGANAGQAVHITIDGMDPASLGLTAGIPSALTRAAAVASLSSLDGALTISSAARAKLGALTNALEHTVNNLGNTSENLAAAESRIRDLDMAMETATLAKMSVLAQASTAMLAQANQSPQAVLELLK